LPANFLAGEDIFNNIKKNSYDQWSHRQICWKH
jgi:Fe-S cluster biosynthesis and repair protein YggX